MSENHKIWFITGISRGLGLELAKAVLARGDVIIGTTRDGDSDLPSVSHRLHVLPLELPVANQATRAIVRAHALHGRLDVIVNNAGYGLLERSRKPATPKSAAFLTSIFLDRCR